MSTTHAIPMDSEQAYQALPRLILAEEPDSQDGKTWDRINLSFTVASPDQRHIDLLVEAVANQLMGQFMDTLGRMFMQDSNNMANMITGPFQSYADAVAALPQRMMDLRALRGAEFCEVIRRTIEERWAARDAVPPWHILNARREAGLDRERRMLLERVSGLFEEDPREMV